MIAQVFNVLLFGPRLGHKKKEFTVLWKEKVCNILTDAMI